LDNLFSSVLCALVSERYILENMQVSKCVGAQRRTLHPGPIAKFMLSSEFFR
jgi:hypothetical protein